MSPSPRSALIGLLLALAACGGTIGDDPGEVTGPAADNVAGGVLPDSQDPADAVFDPGRVHDLALELAPADWALVRDNPWAKTWVKGSFTWNGERLDDIGVRAFGAGSLIAGKPSLKLSFDRHVADQEWRGLDELKLDNASQDVGFLNEHVATAAMRRAGVPASRNGWARVTVNGAPAGFFVVLESVDDRFLERWFGHDDGALYSMKQHNWGQGLNPMADPLTWFEPETSFGGDGQELAAAATVLATGTFAEVEAAVDVGGFLRESVARSVMGSLDSFSADGNNYYLFADRDRVRIIPWDFDVDLGGYYFDTAMTVDAHHPWTTSPWAYNALTRAPYTDPVLRRALEAGADVDALVAELLAGPFAWPLMDASAATGALVIRDAVHADVLGRGAAFEQRALDLRLFLHSRWSALAGREVAHCPAAAAGVRRTADLAATGTVGWGAARRSHAVGPGLHGPRRAPLQRPVRARPEHGAHRGPRRLRSAARRRRPPGLEAALRQRRPLRDHPGRRRAVGQRHPRQLRARRRLRRRPRARPGHAHHVVPRRVLLRHRRLARPRALASLTVLSERLSGLRRHARSAGRSTRRRGPRTASRGRRR